jgi:hypothetical protein
MQHNSFIVFRSLDLGNRRPMQSHLCIISYRYHLYRREGITCVCWLLHPPFPLPYLIFQLISEPVFKTKKSGQLNRTNVPSLKNSGFGMHSIH